MSNKYLIFISFAASLVVTTPAWAWGSSCDKASKEPKPDWLTKADYSKPGFDVAVGSAEKNDKYDFEAQSNASERNARRHLIEQIEVKIIAESAQRIQVGNTGVQDSAINTVVVSAEETLSGLKVQERWVDKENCTVYTLLVISKNSVAQAKREKLMKIRAGKMKTLLVEGSSSERTRGAQARMKLLEDAKIILAGVDFKLINDEFGEPYYAKKITNAMAEVTKELEKTQGRIAIFALNSDGKIPGAVIGKMLDQLRTGDSKTERLMVNCTSEDECISKAREQNYAQLALLKVGTRVETSNMGALKGTLTVTKAVYDIHSKNVLNGPFSASAQVISWGHEELNWESAADKAMQGLK